ncbi:cupin domain-containing protein [Ralstonia soli]|uniref:Cupin domain-containing protein n=1 Tax=Ralstonia soli TaxID=2953896 RepID=A0ABT1AGU9_9RALS|nr:cupin domain-containing protein [Ralstonia soli]MCO5397541.1 cupin domain-containing protein [Ralstonia soli]
MTTALMLHRADGAPLSTVFRQAGLSPTDPFAREREIAWEGPNAMSAGRASFVGQRDVARYPHTETLTVVEGELTLTAPGAEPHVIGAGAGAVIASGTAVRIEAAAGVRFVFCTEASDTPATPALIPLHADADFKPSGGPAPEVLLGPAPQCRSDNVFTNEPTQYRAGTWDSTSYHRIVRPHPVNEFMYVLDGSVRFASPDDPDGSALSVSTGDAIFVPQGTAIGWESTARVAKFYVVQNAQA